MGLLSSPAATFATLLAALTIATAVDTNSTAPVVDLGYTQVQGIEDHTLGTKTFWGLRYAAAPIDERRWRAPVPIEEETYLVASQRFDATTPGAQCVQGTPGWEQALLGGPVNMDPSRTQSEDCLLLDVIVPQEPKSSYLPVIVQIHGGGYTQGTSQSTDGHELVRYSQGAMIYVQIQYRLGVYGFLGGDAIRDDGAANVGLLDQRHAMHWVRRHIAAFGGDPQKITMWGTSAGGGSVSNQLIMYGGKEVPPYRAAIAEYPWWQSYKNQTVLRIQYEDLLNASDCSDLMCLRGLNHTALRNATSKTYLDGYNKGLSPYGDFYFGPYVDGTVIRDLPSKEYERGAWTKVPMIVDHNAYEGASFTNGSISTIADVALQIASLFPAAGPALSARLAQLYPLHDFTGSYVSSPFFNSSTFSSSGAIYGWSKDNANFWKLQQLFGDFIINCPTYYMGTAAANAGISAWKMIFSTGTYIHGGATTVTLAQNSAASNSTLSVIMKDYFLAFVTDLDPNAGANATNMSRPFWPEYMQKSSETFSILQINDTAIGHQADPDASNRCDYWNSQGYVVRN